MMVQHMQLGVWHLCLTGWNEHAFQHTKLQPADSKAKFKRCSAFAIMQPVALVLLTHNSAVGTVTAYVGAQGFWQAR